MALFQKGLIPHNKGKKLEDYLSSTTIDKIRKTQFKKGERIREKSNTWKGGVQTPKNDCTYVYAGINKRVRNPKKVYEEKVDVVPKNWVVYHIDQDKRNDEPDNLIAIPRAVLVMINSGRLNKNWHEISEAVKNYLNR